MNSNLILLGYGDIFLLTNALYLQLFDKVLDSTFPHLVKWKMEQGSETNCGFYFSNILHMHNNCITS